MKKKKARRGADPKNHFKPGAAWKGNKEGARIHDPAKKRLRQLVSSEVREIITMLLELPVNDIYKISRDTKEKTLIRWFARLIVQSVPNGKGKRAEFGLLDRLLDRAIGPVSAKVELSGPGGSPINTTNMNTDLYLTSAERSAEIEKLRKARETLKGD